MCWTDVRHLYAHEVRHALRERNIVVNSILVPLLLYPFLLWTMYSAISFVSGQAQGFRTRVMLEGLPPAHATLRSQLAIDRRYELVELPAPREALRAGQLDVHVHFQQPAGEGPERLQVKVAHDPSWDRAHVGRRRLEESLRLYRERLLEAEGIRRGVAITTLRAFAVQSENVATARELGRSLLARILPPMLIIMLSLAALHPAIDSTAGEREHGTWETLLTLSTSRWNIVLAKYLYVATFALVGGCLNLVGMVLAAKPAFVALLGEKGPQMSFGLPLASLPVVVVGLVALAFSVAAAMLILASLARTYKEGQALGTLVVTAALMLPYLVMPWMMMGQAFPWWIGLVPVANVAALFRDALIGTWTPPAVALAAATQAACVALCLGVAGRILPREEFLLGTYEGGPGRFLRRLLRSRAAVAGGARG